MEPLQITAKLGGTGNVAGAEDLPIDSILAAAWMRRHEPEAYYQSRHLITVDNLIDAELPLLKINPDTPLWYWAASFVVWPEVAANDFHYWNKRIDHREMHRVGDVKRLDIKAGRYKAYHMPIPTRAALELRWWVVGDKAEIESLLFSITSIGKKKSQGWGAVRQWTVEPMAEDWSCYREGKPTRTIPLEEGWQTKRQDGFHIGLRTFRPPYWFAPLQTMCMLADREALIYDGTSAMA